MEEKRGVKSQKTNSKSKTDTKEKKGIPANEIKVTRQIGFLIGYYILALLFSFWLLLDTWGNNFALFRAIGLSAEALKEPLLRTIGFTFVGGFLGNILYQIRILFYFYTKDRYDPRWFGKYLTSPWEAAGMALVVLSLIRGGVALFGGSTGTDVEAVNNFAAIGTGALVGFGMRDVVGWLGSLVQTMFTFSEHDKFKERQERKESEKNKQP